MKISQKLIACSSVLLGMAVASVSVHANSVSSNDADCLGGPTSRVFTVTANSVIKCLAKGTGNINGNSDMFQLANPGYLYLDSSDPTAGPGLMNGSLTGNPVLTQGLGGTFNISPSVYLTYKDVAIGFKVGEGQLDPDWAVFQLAPNTLTGTWAVSGNQALSHAMLYGKLCALADNCGSGGGPGGGSAPEPGSLALLGLGLLGMTVVRLRTS